MRLTVKERQKITAMLSRKYQTSSKKDKGKILNEYIELTKYNRSYASYLLSNWGNKIKIRTKEEDLVFMLGQCRKKNSRRRKKIYGENVVKPLKNIWHISGLLCGKLLKEYIESNLEILEKFGEIKIIKKEREKLMKISPATIDRILSIEKKKLELKARSGTKPGTLLKNKIPIRTYSEWDEQKPGFLELDLVSHNGGDPSGEFIQTLDATDIHTTWTETEAVRNKAQTYVFKGIQNIRQRIPFKMLGIDSDNGSEFINDQLYRYCQKDKITFTRSRPLRKNDNCYVEQKNYSVVRKTVGYYRYEGEEELALLNEIYQRLRLITNHFTPTMKLKSKERIGSKVIKKYDKPKTPYKRVIDSKYISKEYKEQLKAERIKLNPAKLRREMLQLQKKLIKAVEKRKRLKKAA